METVTIVTPNLLTFAAPPPADDTCRTCFYFQSSIRWGTCNSPDVEARANNALIHLVEFHETFGCKFHYPKEATE
jgi:hypothetical protein